MRFITDFQSKRSAPLSAAFTLVEMLIVVAMIGLLMGSVFQGVSHGRRQAHIAKANTELRELVNAWLSYEQAYDIPSTEILTGDKGEFATESNLADLLGKGDDDMIYLNAPMKSGKQGRGFCDPWGNLYRFRIIKKKTGGRDKNNFEIAITFPNRNMGKK
ncbi:MAG: type II secretion system protein [Kiritimatiellae bacterium]|nr:type II secretion system protein [Kiritimatiellia bacterium]